MASAPISHSLLEDIVVDILARLPVKSLKRFRCVGKSWCSLIQSPQFISAHFSFSKNKAYPLVNYWEYSDLHYGKNAISIISNQTFDIVANLDIPPFTDYDIPIYIRGYCNGIICLWSPEETVLLWNIATKEFKTIPVCPFESPPGFSNHDVDVVCMGYDCKRDDYKVIRIDTFWNDDFEYEDPRSMRGKQVALYSLSTDSWRKLNANLTLVHFSYYLAACQFYSNGFFHCLASVEKEKVFDEEVLLSFDMSSEDFVTTPKPDGAEKSTLHFMEINGSVGGICEPRRNTDCCYEVWVLGEVGVKNSWIKLFTIGPVFLAERLLGVGSDGNFFFKGKYGRKFLVWHHPSNREIKALRIQGNKLEVAVYAESLVSLRVGSTFHN